MIAEPLQVWAGTLAIDLARYLLVAGAAFLIFWTWGREKFSHKLVQRRYPKVEKLWHDFRWSMSTVFIFSLVGVLVWYGARNGVFRYYEDIDEHGVAWFASSILLLIVLQDAYFYFTHRAMHHRRLFRLFHRTHHVSTNPSPWTAYAFSPLEALVHAAFVPLIWLVLPLHELAIFAFLAFMIVRNVLGHLSMELYPSGFTRSRFWGFHTTTTHHALHHKYFTSNFGLYFTFWDRLLGTTHPDYDMAFESVQRAPQYAAYGAIAPAAPSTLRASVTKLSTARTSRSARSGATRLRAS